VNTCAPALDAARKSCDKRSKPTVRDAAGECLHSCPASPTQPCHWNIAPNPRPDRKYRPHDRGSSFAISPFCSPRYKRESLRLMRSERIASIFRAARVPTDASRVLRGLLIQVRVQFVRTDVHHAAKLRWSKARHKFAPDQCLHVSGAIKSCSTSART